MKILLKRVLFVVILFIEYMGVAAIASVHAVYYQKLVEVQQKLDCVSARAGLSSPLFSNLLAQASSGNTAVPAAVSDVGTDAYNSIIAAASTASGLDEDLIRAVIQAESSFNTNAVSSAGAQGLMQLMPRTAASLGVTDPFDAQQNIFAGTQYLSKQIERFGDVRLALAAYNTGPSRVASLNITDADNVDQYTKLSTSVRAYVDRVLSYRDVYKGG